MNLEQLNYIGTGPYFPIKLTTVLDENGNPTSCTTRWYNCK